MKTTHFFYTVILIGAGCFLQIINLTASENNPKNSVIVAVQPPQQRTPEEMAKRESDWMKTDLALTPEQMTKVDTINLKYANKMRAVWDASQGDRDAMRTKRAELDKQKRAELEPILTADQLKKYDESLANRRQRMQNRQGN